MEARARTRSQIDSVSWPNPSTKRNVKLTNGLVQARKARNPSSPLSAQKVARLPYAGTAAPKVTPFISVTNQRTPRQLRLARKRPKSNGRPTLQEVEAKEGDTATEEEAVLLALPRSSKPNFPAPTSAEQNRHVIDGKPMFYLRHHHNWVPDRFPKTSSTTTSSSSVANVVTIPAALSQPLSANLADTSNAAARKQAINVAVANATQSVGTALSNLAAQFGG